jgi:hypothetical protein
VTLLTANGTKDVTEADLKSSYTKLDFSKVQGRTLPLTKVQDEFAYFAFVKHSIGRI